MASTWWSRLIPTRRRVVSYILVILAILVLRLVLGFWAGYHLRSVSAPLAAKYGGLDMASLAPPRVAPADNRARILAAAAALTVLVQDARKMAELYRALSAAGPTDPAARQAILRPLVAENELALSVLDRAESRSGANWEIPYRDGPDFKLPSLMEIRALANVNAAAALVALAEGQADEAARHARLGVVLANSLAQEPIMMTQLFRAAVERFALRAVRETIAGGEPSASALEALAGRLSEADGESDVVGLIGELKYVSAIIERTSHGDMKGFWRVDVAWPTAAAAGAILWAGRPLFLAAHAEALRQLDVVIEYARPQPFERAALRLPPPSSVPQPWWLRPFPMLQSPAPHMDSVVHAGDVRRAIRALAQTAVALRRHRLAHGAYPATLSELDATLLPRPPVNPYTGRPVDYSREGSGFTLRIPPPPSAPRDMEARDMLTWTVPR
jgi:hypothetical protein